MKDVAVVYSTKKEAVAFLSAKKLGVAVVQQKKYAVVVARIFNAEQAGGDKFYAHDQMTASALWTVNHNLNKYPSVSVTDSAGNVVEGDIAFVSGNQLTIVFSSAFAGKAYCN